MKKNGRNFSTNAQSNLNENEIAAMDNIRSNKQFTVISEINNNNSELNELGLGLENYELNMCIGNNIVQKSVLNPKGDGQRRSSVMSQIKTRLRDNAKSSQFVIASTCSTSANCSVISENEFPLTQDKFIPNITQTDFFGLPPIVKELMYTERGISELYEWQKECLNLPSVRERKNLIYSLPTSGGKTLVAEILMFKELLIHCKNVVFALPYISIVQEKVRSLAPFAVDLDFLVEEYAGGKGQIPPKKRLRRNSVFIATIEKANLLINSLFETGRIDEIGLLVVDELHLLCEGGRRAATLEMALTKVKCKAPHIHIIGMSATLTNISDVRNFLNAELYTGDFRPVELKEYVKTGDEIYHINYQNQATNINFVKVRTLKSVSKQQKTKDPDMIVFMLSEILPFHSCLIFCPTKKHCENLASFVVKEFPSQIKTHKEGEKRELIRALLEDGNGKICSVLKLTIPYGVAYHHSGLTMEERRLIEEAYSEGTLCCLACTSTLAAGVNLPAKRVIIRAPYVGRNWISTIQYKQMVGRAGRAGLDTSGESYLMVKPEEKQMVEKILYTSNETYRSSLFDNDNEGFKVFILNLAGLQLIKHKEDVDFLVSQTLYSVQNPKLIISDMVSNAIEELTNSGHLMMKDNILKATSLGNSTFKSGLDINTTPLLYEDLMKSLHSLSLNTDLHLLFITTPYDLMNVISIEVDVYCAALSALTLEEQKTAMIIGIPESYVFQLMTGKSSHCVNKKIAHRFYITLILNDLWNRKSIWQVAQKFKIHRGLVCSLLSNASAFGSSILRFCQELSEFWAFCELLPKFLQQLHYCCEPELITLMDLPCVKQGRARQLSSAGFKNLADIAKTTSRELSMKVDHLSLHAARQMISSAKMLLIERAEALREEAEVIVEGIEVMDTSTFSKSLI